MANSYSVLVVGCGNMGSSHALAYHEIDDFKIVGLVDLQPEPREKLNQKLGGGYRLFNDFEKALEMTKPDVVSINTYPDTHEHFAVQALESGAHVFVEKPIAPTVEGCRRVIQTAQTKNKKLLTGYILRHHPSWIRFVEIARTLGKPLVMRMNLNQQSKGQTWETHKNLMKSASPIVDCGVHYVDVMCQMTGASPIRVSAIGARLSDELVPDMYNYGQLQITFNDGSVGWYEAGWGPMMSETAFFVKDVVGPKGCVSIVASKAGAESQSDNVAAHTQTENLKVHYSKMDKNGTFVHQDEWINLSDEPDHNELCKREQQYLLKAIQKDIDLNSHLNDAMNSIKIVIAADESVRSGKTIQLA
ncbi:Gfo/Idh/MocA family oxidoreductase [bacterium]|nr:Gfo/Idh/MocA family oxidoreductase [bacterium]RQV97815.1 MAG: gfo/Idh/MocA family oxidoreductase [bacterium]